jgi:hypothetical protein
VGDLVLLHVTKDLPVRLRTLAFADRVEVRFGNAFPVALLVDGAALDSLIKWLEHGRAELAEHTKQRAERDEQ